MVDRGMIGVKVYGFLYAVAIMIALAVSCNAQELAPQVKGTEAELNAKIQQLQEGMKKLPANSPKKPSYLLNLGNTYYTLKQYDDSLSSYQAAAALLKPGEEDYSTAKILAGECYEALGKTVEAKNEYKQCYYEKSVNGSIAFARYANLASSETELHDIANWIIACDDRNIDDSKINIFREMMEKISSSNKKLAQTAYESWLAAHPDHYATPILAIEYNRLTTPLGTEKSADLAPLVEKYYRHNAASLLLRYDLGMAYLYENNQNEALVQFDRVLIDSKDIDSNSTFYSENMIIDAEKTKAMILFDIGEHASANKIVEKIIKEHPESSQAAEIKRIADRHNNVETSLPSSQATETNRIAEGYNQVNKASSLLSSGFVITVIVIFLTVIFVTVMLIYVRWKANRQHPG